MKTSNLRRFWQPALQWSLIVPMVLGLQAAQAATTDLADVPLFTSSASVVKPNILFILDDSGSMARDYTPDNANFATTKYGRLSSQCNGQAYNPAIAYGPPVDSLGVPAAAGSTAFLNPDPNARTTDQRSLSTASITVVNSGSVSVVFPSSPTPQSGWYSNGDTVTIFSSTDTAKYMEGTVTGWSTSTRTLTISVSYAVGTGTSLSSLRVGDGGAPYYWKYKGAQTALDYLYTSGGVITTTTFYQECNSNVGSTPGSSVFDRVVMSTASSDAQNYANWYAYYRTRMEATKAAVSQAFKDIGDRFRVGYTTISEDTATPGTKFLDVETFDKTQKDSFYAALMGATPNAATPLRGALSKAGRYFANKAPGQTKDPIQYSCQKNFAILSTDGYWNTRDESGTYGPFDVNGGNVGQQDGAVYPYPIRDGADIETTTVETWSRTRTQVTQTATVDTSYLSPTTTTTGVYGAGSGSRADTYSGYRTNNTIARCSWGSSPCTITVTTSTNHGYVAGNKVTIVNASPSAYNGTWTLTSGSGTTYTFQMATRPSSNTSPGRTLAAGSCPAGQGSVTRTSTQTDTYPLTLTAVTTASKVDTSSYTQTETITVTPYTRTVKVSNGATISDVTTPGTPTVTTTPQTPPPTTVATSAYTSAPSSSAGTPATVVTNLGASTVCSSTASNGTVAVAVVSTKPADTTSTVATTIPATSVPTTTTLADSTVDGTKTSVVTDSSTGGSSNSLADVAHYYYKTDLRTSGLANCDGALGVGTNVCQSTDIAGADTNVTQNMITFTLGLGVSGTLKYAPDYLVNPKNSDYYALTQGTKKWPNPLESSTGGDPRNIDDLWHAAVDGHGQYFSAGDPNAVVTSLQTALRKITEIKGSAAAAATSTLQPVDGDNDIFVAQFVSGKWVGDVRKYSIDPSSGAVSTSYAWSAAEVLDARVADLNAGVTGAVPRKIYYFRPTTGNEGTLASFTYSNLVADSLNANFDGFCAKPGVGGGAAPAQCATLSAGDLTTANTGSNLVAYLIGGTNSVYRTRQSALGDVINSSPLYVGPPKFKYTENGYASWAASKASRPGVLYLGANDGMLHAFDRATGAEKWAYMPSDVLPNLYKLADTDYDYNHQFFVDGSAQVGDVFDGTNWRTIVVGGMNKGGKMYYALDVTDPDNPIALWEFRDADLGLTFGNPIITKRKDGTWIVAFASGYNNIGDGNGHLYVVDAITGTSLITGGVETYTSGTTPAGTSTTPSGLAKINAFIESEIDNTAKVFYGGDLLGNVWRFDIDSNVAPFGKAMLLANLSVSGTPQPITTKPEIAEVTYGGSKYNVVYVGTGKYLGTGDLSNTDLQSVYALKDEMTSTGLGDVRTAGTLVTQTISAGTSSSGGAIRTATTNAVNWQTKSGWMVDLPSSGERVNVNMVLSLNVLSVASNVPTSDVCDAGGRSWLYKFDIGTGSAVSNATDMAVAIPMGNVLVAGQTVVQLPDGRTVTISTLSDTSLRTDQQPPPPVAGVLRRTSWRELAN
jgi:type IV pilus assembly protein PilY1